MKDQKVLNTWIEISRSGLNTNIKNLKKTLKKDTLFMSVLKANAYGHGLEQVSSVLISNPLVDWFGVFLFRDALYLRAKTQKPILVLETIDNRFLSEAIVKNISVTISRFDQLIAIAKLKNKSKLKIHLKLDTGLHRQGFSFKDIEKIISFLEKYPSIKIEGIYSHLIGAESFTFDKTTKRQHELLTLFSGKVQKLQKEKIITHISGTSGVLRNPYTGLGMVRFGIGIYGLWPSEETKKVIPRATMTPVLSWNTKIIEVKEIQKGDTVAYDATFVAKRKTKIAVLPVGYWDGLPRSLSSKGQVLIRGQKATILGRVMMNMCIVDVSHIQQVAVGDIVTLIGENEGKFLHAEDMAKQALTINYEIVTRINPYIERFLTR